MVPEIAVIILAAGLGTRMRSDKAKVLHEVCGVPMICHVIRAARSASLSGIIAVIGYQAKEVRRRVEAEFDGIRFALQTEQLGTGHAALCAMDQVARSEEHVLILCGDVPLISPETIIRMISQHLGNDRDLTLMAVTKENPTGYGRLIIDRTGQVNRIVEEADATDMQKTIQTVNAGIYCVRTGPLQQMLNRIDRSNAQNEMYLTDIVELGNSLGFKVGAFTCQDTREVIGVNSLEDLQQAEKTMKTRLGKSS